MKKLSFIGFIIFATNAFSSGLYPSMNNLEGPQMMILKSMNSRNTRLEGQTSLTGKISLTDEKSALLLIETQDFGPVKMILNPKFLADQHLVAEYNEILMLVSYFKKFPEVKDIPKNCPLPDFKPLK